MSRNERDALGNMEIPDECYWGIQTERAVRNFPVTGRRERPGFIHSYALVKKAAALANMALGELDPSLGAAIVKASDEIATGVLDDQFPVDVFQAGAGTSFNMNLNEVIANRALEILSHNKGEYDFLSPNDHVNLGQSSNDTFPTASHLAIIQAADSLDTILRSVSRSFHEKAREFALIPKPGRTHLMDAVPVMLSDEFHAYGTAIERCADLLRYQRGNLLEVPIGGTATGTGVNSHPEYRPTVILELRRLSSLDLSPARDSFEALQSRSQMSSFSGALRSLALELIRIANDLRLIGSGPHAGLGEIHLPAVQPGSSIMPGKVNPVMAECLDMVAFQVVAHDTAVSLAAQAGQMELNVMTPVMIYNILESLAMLTSYLPAFEGRCIKGITADKERCLAGIEGNPMLATILAPRIGYLKAAELAIESQRTRRPVKDLAIEKGIIGRDEADSIFDPLSLARKVFR